MYKVSVSRESDSIPTSKMEVGDFAKYKGCVILKTFYYWVNLSNPQADWSDPPEGNCELLPRDTVLVIKRYEGEVNA